MSKLQELAPFDVTTPFVPVHDGSEFIQLGSFAIRRGGSDPLPANFNFSAPTVQHNAMRVMRACQVLKPILLEGSPGVGKTSLVDALAKLSGYVLHRINLSDQTDLMDLFGSDLPVEGGAPGQFAWKDAEFLTALQEGHWVLLDEMNLAPQAVLEGLNAILDHRGTVYIPELGRSFQRHPSFRIFAAQNPLSQGGGRKGLPKSFINRFTRVHINQLNPDDLLFICRHLFPTIETDVLKAMITFNSSLADAVLNEKAFGRDGSPWEFNLRDVSRWGALLKSSSNTEDPSTFVPSVFLHRFRHQEDRDKAVSLFHKLFQSWTVSHRNPHASITPTCIRIGDHFSVRSVFVPKYRPRRLLKMQLSALETLGHCVNHSWLAIVTGGRGSGKSDIVRALANFTDRQLEEIPINSSTDTMDILGSFEQVDTKSQAIAIAREVVELWETQAQFKDGSKNVHGEDIERVRRFVKNPSIPFTSFFELASRVVENIARRTDIADKLDDVAARITSFTKLDETAGHFRWIDGPLVRAMKAGVWVILDGANTCNPSVLDRLNSLCEPGGVLTLTERGYVDGRVPVVVPHPDFRLFMSVDPQFGELSRAMRNRGMEVALISRPLADDELIIRDFERTPSSMYSSNSTPLCLVFEAVRRGVMTAARTRPSAQFTSGRTLSQDSAMSNVFDSLPIYAHPREDSLFQVITRFSGPGYHGILKRYLYHLSCGGNNSDIIHFLQSIEDMISEPLDRLKVQYSKAIGAPEEFIREQV
jgi:midasin